MMEYSAHRISLLSEVDPRRQTERSKNSKYFTKEKEGKKEFSSTIMTSSGIEHHPISSRLAKDPKAEDSGPHCTVTTVTVMQDPLSQQRGPL